MICKIDNTDHPDRESLHRHLRKLKVRQEDYYTTYEPKICRYNGSPIPFKNWSEYLSTDFSSKSAMQSWMVENPHEAKGYAAELIERRAKNKALTYIPCEVELKSLGYPRARYYESIGGLNKIGGQLGLKTRFDYSKEISLTEDIANSPIIVDTREQLPLSFPGAIHSKLEFGDYALQSNQSLAIERKSLNDLIGTLILGYDRFIREIERVDEVGGYLVVACETDLNSTLEFDSIPNIARHTKIKPQIVFHNIREIIQRFESVQFLFCNGRDELKRLIPIILNARDLVKTVDLQHLYTEGRL